jgi:protein MpaA
MDSETQRHEVPRSETGIIRHESYRYGHSVKGTALECYGPRSGPVDMLIIASVHGDETDTTVVLSEALRSIAADGIANPVILCTNPDGAVRGTRCNAKGVDLNRNLPTANWSAEAVLYRGHGQERQEIELGTGDHAGSEPETAALLELVARLKPRSVVSLHAPLACVEDPQGKPLAQWIADQVGLPLVPDVGYVTPGSFGTWCAEQGINIVTWELPSEPLADMIASHAPVLRRLITADYPPEIV